MCLTVLLTLGQVSKRARVSSFYHLSLPHTQSHAHSPSDSYAYLQALNVLESGDADLIRSSWEEAKASIPAEDLGEIFFKELARIAPHVTHLFKRPKRIQALQFINVIEMLVSFNESPEKFFQV